MNILLLSAYDAQSHQYWRKNLVQQFPAYHWTVLTLPARYFSWRIRGNSLSWSFTEKETLERDYDLIIATSMCDLSALRGFVPHLATIPTIVYVHENQFAYPNSSDARKNVEPELLNLYTTLAADHVVFNSHYNQDSFFSGADLLLQKLPDHIPTGLIETLKRKSSVIPVPLKDEHFCQHSTHAGPLNILWNHRWEYDKGPDKLLATLRALKQLTEKFTLHIIGQKFRTSPAEFDTIQSEFLAQIGQWGYVESEADYRELLSRCDAVISTAEHDFQGLAILEAVAAGCLPATPNRLAYPELLGAEYCYQSGDGEAEVLAKKLFKLVQLKRSNKLPFAPRIEHLGWKALRPDYQTLINQIANRT